MSSEAIVAAEEAWANVEKGTGKLSSFAITTKIEQLQASAKEARQARRFIAKELKAERRKKTRIMARCKSLTNTDMIMMLAERKLKASRLGSKSDDDASGGSGGSGSGSAAASSS